MIKKITLCYFSPTGGTKKVSLKFAAELIKNIKELGNSALNNIGLSEIDFTKPEVRKKRFEFSDEDILVIASPVYAGRIPNKIAPEFKKAFHGNNTKCVVLCCYGNRSYGGALTEMRLIMQETGFQITAAAAIVSQHPFSDLVGEGRPSPVDFKELSGFAKEVSKIVISDKNVNLPFNTEIPPYYIPLKTDNTPAKFLKAKPVTDLSLCDNCGICAGTCPVGSIDISDCSKTPGICIKCQACIKVCPHGAKTFIDEDFLSHVKMLEINYTKPKENIFILPEDSVN